MSAGRLAWDVVHAARSMRRRPAWTIATVATIALAVGVPTALFTLVNEIVLRPVPGVSSGDLVNVYLTREGIIQGFSGHSYDSYLAFAGRNRTLASLAAFAGRGFAVDHGGETEMVFGQFVSGSFFGTLGTRPLVGRLLDERDDRLGSATGVVISHHRWLRQFNADPAAVGAPLRVNQHVFTILGVAEPGFRGHFIGFPSDLFLPLHASPLVAGDLNLDHRTDDSLELIGRIRSTVSLAQARADLERIARELAHESAAREVGRGVAVLPWNGLDADLQGSVVGFVGALALVAGLVMTIACANTAGLLLHYTQARRREFAVRQALGASRGQLATQLLVESWALFVAGGLAGLWLAGSSVGLLHLFLPALPLPVRLDLAVDWRVAAFALSVTLAAALTFGVAPSIAAARVHVVSGLRRELGDTPSRLLARRVFVAAQIALSLTLLIVAAAFTSALRAASQADNGFAASRVATATVDVRVLNRPEHAGRTFFAEWLRRAADDPAIESAALARSLPLDFGSPVASLGVDRPSASGALEVEAGWTAVTAAYFETLGVPLLAGRTFLPSDDQQGERVTVVSRRTAERLFSGADAVGRHLRRGDETLRVVGVVDDVAVHQAGARDAFYFYVPFAQSYRPRMTLVARGRFGTPLDALRRAARGADRDLPVLTVEPLGTRVGALLFPQRMAASIAGAFGTLGLMLSAVAIYGIVSFTAAQRRREFALRQSLGAEVRHVRRLVARDGLWPAAAGLTLGLAGAVVAVDLAQRLVPTAQPPSVAALALPVALLAAVAILAADVPARRAARVDPTVVLREE